MILDTPRTFIAFTVVVSAEILVRRFLLVLGTEGALYCQWAARIRSRSDSGIDGGAWLDAMRLCAVWAHKFHSSCGPSQKSVTMST